MKSTLAQNQRCRLEAGITAHIKQLQYFKKQLHLVDDKIFSAGKDLFESAPILALWLCEPAPSLGGKVPLKIMCTAKGRAAVATALVRITHGCL
ncbi:DUF2384 domain-containing protein [Oleiharenicola lentus]|uniref:DUF2384 domain-containing protein n=1 Tax=Oleiharenicola lentus TaxID=2508720 RepID=A0A4Q1C4W4_9BACT|nr:MbcA/ParS/Xre antitoxin family protein [Oleiharenicola lentus]RXK53468.1 DUF2384 domain-containing protein [Oleiharenicola lentus]